MRKPGLHLYRLTNGGDYALPWGVNTPELRSNAVRTVLIVDDEPHLRLLYEIELRHAGYSTVTASNAEQCLEYIAVMKPDIVILDIRMPGMDGVEVLHRIIAKGTRIPIIVNTAYSDYRDNYLTWVADAFLVKSSDLTELIDTVKKLLPERQTEAHRRISSEAKRSSDAEGECYVEGAV